MKFILYIGLLITATNVISNNLPNISATDGDYTRYVRISWGRYEGNVEYRVYRGISGTGRDLKPISDWQGEPLYLDASAVLGQKYYYGIKIRKSDGKIMDGTDNLDIGYRSNFETIETVGYETVISNIEVYKKTLALSASDGGHIDYVLIKLISYDGEAEYQLYRGIDSSGTDLEPIDEWTDTRITSYFDEDVIPGQKYYYGIKIRTPDGKVIDATNMLDAGYRSNVLNRNISTLSATNGEYKDYVKIEWDRYEGEAKYHIYRTVDGINLDCISRGQKESYYLDSTAISGKKYFYLVDIYPSDTKMVGETNSDIGYRPQYSLIFSLPATYNETIKRKRTFDIAVTIVNHGIDKPSSDLQLAFYISDDNVIDSSDINIYTMEWYWDTTTSATIERKLKLPKDTGKGEKYIIVTTSNGSGVEAITYKKVIIK